MLINVASSSLADSTWLFQIKGRLLLPCGACPRSAAGRAASVLLTLTFEHAKRVHKPRTGPLDVSNRFWHIRFITHRMMAGFDYSCFVITRGDIDCGRRSEGRHFSDSRAWNSCRSWMGAFATRAC